MPEQFGEKSQDPTPHRRQQAREEGNVARSQDLNSALLLLGSAIAVRWYSGGLSTMFGELAHAQLGGAAWLEADPAWAATLCRTMLGQLAGQLLPLLAMIMAVAGASQAMQVGLVFLPQKLAPDITRLDPIKGFERIFSLAGLVRLAFGLFKVCIVGGVAYASLMARHEEILGLVGLTTPEMAVYLADILFWTTMHIGGALLVLALFDYGFQWWKNEQDLRMTTQEIREEMKNLQGDPQVAARRRQVQRQLTMNRLKSTVPKADVVVTNPTELAIAIQYDPAEMEAPVVLAKGAGVLAQRIRQLALENGIPIVEKKPLAQALYKEVEVNQAIPHRMYAAVAEILAYVYQLKGKKPKLPPRAA